MMRQFELVERVLAYNPDADEALLNKAYVYAMQKHGSQKRASGDPYFAHPLEVAAILTSLKLDDATVAVGLLHDTIEDTDATRAEIDQVFGPEIGAIVDGLTKIDRLNLASREEAQAENLRKLLLAIAEDVRVLIVKLADRLHNMRTLDFVPPEKRQRIAHETMDIYAPLAGRMGMQEIRSELEDLSFRALEPEKYAALEARLAAMRTRNAEMVQSISADLRRRIAEAGIPAEVSGRLKSPWSIFSKIQRQHIALEQLSDIIGFRVIVETEEDCYRTLGVIHRAFKIVPGRFKDYISVPKYNDYRSIHTTVVGPERQRVELQIRTRTMHQVAEYGIAAHALYKDDLRHNIERLKQESQAYVWLRSTIDTLTSGSAPEDFLEDTKLELFQDQVFCFTPRGRLIALPRGATPIDFAYAVHTELGDTCVGAKINGTIMPLVTQLRAGDEVQIMTDANHVPPANWESIAATGKARAAIRRAVRASVQKRAHAHGEYILSAVLQGEGTRLDDAEFAVLVGWFGYESRKDFVTAVGENKVDPDALVEEISKIKGVPRRRKRRDINLPVADTADGWFGLRKSDFFRFRVPGGQTVGEQGHKALAKLGFDTEVRISPEGVVPGDRIIAILTPDGVLTVYPVHSDALTSLHQSDVAWIDVRWDLSSHYEASYTLAISMLSPNRPGSLAAIAGTIARFDANVVNLFMRMDSPEYHRMIFLIEVRDLPHVSEVLAALKDIPGLSEIRRASISEASALSRVDFAMPEREENRP
ncbi:MAG: bifunctional (p)ppGpp synthetase/guanosine-3',5'-bis(diphosphate) 3'-pyrophosphohydrolase [Alphaproteobacteria bacterium]|nr:bifunctional (p)ppGpp synthetase/guanosine-3',5'-bis(diphosphate) 3'-pyrophosphohydrolase [Alphaproteobacteria bacterium]